MANIDDNSSKSSSPHPLERSGSKAKMKQLLGTDPAKTLIATKKMGRSSENLVADEKKIDLRSSLSKKFKYPSSYKFSIEDSPNNILFDDQDPRLIKAGTLPKLVERLTYDEQIDPNFLFEFLLTYRSFTTPREFLKLLIERWNTPNPVDVDQQELESFQRSVLKPIRLRVFNVLKKWLDEHWYDWEADQTLLDDLKVFVEENVKQSGMENVATALSKLIAKKLDGEEKNATIVFDKPAPPSIEPDVKLLTGNAGRSSHLAILAFHPEEIARQVTLIEHQLFKSIKPWECIAQSWAKKDKETKAPNILGMILRFNKVSMWVKNTIVTTENLKSRTEAVVKFIEVAERLRAMNNFNGIMEILAGLRSAAVHRLKKTWEHMKTFEELTELMSPFSNYTKFRNHLHKEISPPCIPYLGVYLTDLTFIEDGNPDTIQDLINFDKRRRTAQVIKEIKEYQNTQYNFNVVPIIKGFLLAGGEYVDENECYRLSLLIEPKEPTTKEGSTPPDKKKRGLVKMMRKSIQLKIENRKTLRNSFVLDGSSPSGSPSASSPLSLSSSGSPRLHRSPSFENVIESALEGNSSAVDYYIEGLASKSEKEKESLREEMSKMINSRQRQYEEEIEEVPFDMLLGYLEDGNNAAFEKYLSNYDYYDAELIRAQVCEQYTKKKAFSMI